MENIPEISLINAIPIYVCYGIYNYFYYLLYMLVFYYFIKKIEI